MRKNIPLDTGKKDKYGKSIRCGDVVKSSLFGIKIISDNLEACELDGLFTQDSKTLEIIGIKNEQS